MKTLCLKGIMLAALIDHAKQAFSFSFFIRDETVKLSYL